MTELTGRQRSLSRPAKKKSAAEKPPAVGPFGVRLKVVFHPEEGGGYWVEVPAPRGCHTQGDTPEEAVANAREAVAGWLEAAQDAHPPEPGARAVVLEVPL